VSEREKPKAPSAVHPTSSVGTPTEEVDCDLGCDIALPDTAAPHASAQEMPALGAWLSDAAPDRAAAHQPISASEGPTSMEIFVVADGTALRGHPGNDAARQLLAFADGRPRPAPAPPAAEPRWRHRMTYLKERLRWGTGLSEAQMAELRELETGPTAPTPRPGGDVILLDVTVLNGPQPWRLSSCRISAASITLVGVATRQEVVA
jgi:hypothetical protein